MPAVAATGNYRRQAFASGSPDIARCLAHVQIVPEVPDYSDQDALLASDRIDAV
jgi:predicted dehydrogenase